MNNILSQFRGCKLCADMWGGPVFCEGNPAPICWVGEALGEQEVKQSRPLIGPAGQTFNLLLMEADIKREEQFLMNTVSCRPPKNEINDVMVARCRPLMQSLIKYCDPKVIVALGTTASKALLPGLEKGIINKRGTVGEYDNNGKKVPVVITLHPSFVMRSESMASKGMQSSRVSKLYRQLVVGDFRLAAKMARGEGGNGRQVRAATL